MKTESLANCAKAFAQLGVSAQEATGAFRRLGMSLGNNCDFPQNQITSGDFNQWVDGSSSNQIYWTHTVDDNTRGPYGCEIEYKYGRDPESIPAFIPDQPVTPYDFRNLPFFVIDDPSLDEEKEKPEIIDLKPQRMIDLE